MPQYTLATGSLTDTTLKAAVGKNYNVGLSDGTHYFGYQLQNWGTQTKQRRLYGASVQDGFVENSDVTTRGALTQFGSPSLVDRDLVYYPRVSQGDFAGGALQAVFIDATKFYDSDLEVRTPGYLTLRPAWVRNTLAAAGSVVYQSVVFNGKVYTAWGAASVYASDGTTINPAMSATLLDTDGNLLFMADGVNTLKSWDGTSFVTISAAIGAIKQMWAINLGTSQRSLYYTTDNIVLLRVDLVANTTAVVVPTGGTQFTIKDVAPYQSGVAILTVDKNGGGSTDVWYHDGQNLTRIIHLTQYVGVGLCDALGTLFLTATSAGNYEAPVLLRIDSGVESVAVRAGSPLTLQTSAGIGDPVSSGQFVYFTLSNPQINGVTTTSYIGVFDLVTGAYSHLGAMDANDAPQVSQPRQIAVSGRAVAFPMTLGGNATLQSQTNSSLLPAGNFFIGSGWVVSSNFDFATPAIEKRFRTIEVHHAPLAAGESVKVACFVDLDPVSFTTASTPTGTTTNSTVGTNTTTLSFGANVGVGHMMFFALQLTAGTGGATTPKIHYVTVEVGGTWVWDLDLDCSFHRRDLTQNFEDPQGVTGKDLYFLIRNAYENGLLLTLYLAEGVTYTVAIETVGGNNVSYMDKATDGTIVNADQEWLCHVVLRQVA